MCQSKENGGKRCVKHAAASKFVVRITRVKTGADAPFVEKMLSELNREGKKLSAPNKTEVQTWLETQKFATQYDPELSEHERLIELNQLSRAEREAESGVTGGQFHAWKNLMKTVKENWKRKLLAAAMVPIIGFGVAGCTINQADPGNGSSTSAFEFIDGGDYLIYDEKTDTDILYSSLINKDGLVETEDGSYYTWWIPSPETDPASYSDEYWHNGATTAELEQAGYTASDVAQARYLAYQMTQIAYDSETVDKILSNNERTEWVTAVSQTIPLSAEVQSVMSQENTQVVMQGYKDGVGQLPVLLKDGTTRSVSESPLYAMPKGFTVQSNESGSFLVASFSTDVSYRVSDESMLAYLEAQGASNIPRDILSDGKGTNLLHVKGTYDVAVQKQADGSLQIVGLQDTYEISTDY